MSLSTYLEYARRIARLYRRRCRAYAPTSITASQDHHEKINSWVFFFFMSMGLCLLVFRAAGAPLSTQLTKAN